MQILDHLLELTQNSRRSLFASSLGGISVVRSKEVESVVTPVVGHALTQQVLLGEVGMNGKEFHSRDTEFLEVGRHGFVTQACIGSTKFERNTGVHLGQTAHVSFIDHGLVERSLWLLSSSPVEAGVDHNRAPLVSYAAQALGIGIY